ncbi:hypothetical protein [Thetidibacter halocola]|nr:hypothetical protein [Thetidibacter halocola]
MDLRASLDDLLKAVRLFSAAAVIIGYTVASGIAPVKIKNSIEFEQRIMMDRWWAGDEDGTIMALKHGILLTGKAAILRIDDTWYGLAFVEEPAVEVPFLQNLLTASFAAVSAMWVAASTAALVALLGFAALAYFVFI